MQETVAPRRAGESGFALILAILSLMLLTFLGLTLAATTSTELQIATNYRWSQQALYNAEAGLEAARLLLAQIGAHDASFQNILPTTRPGSWDYGVTGAPGGPPDPRTLTPARSGLRDYERIGCADRAGVGYGRILTSPTGTANPGDYQNVSQFGGLSLNGAFTLWVRRAVTAEAGTDKFQDVTDNSQLVVVSEGVAPYTTPGAFAAANQARRVLEVSYTLLVNQGKRCEGLSGQEGLSASGENFDPCSPLKAGGVSAAFRGASGADTGAR